MSKQNDTTIGSYESHVKEYIAGTPQEVSEEFRNWIDSGLLGSPHDASILELGSGFGRDADYIESMGYIVERTDATQAFVDLLQSQGNKAWFLNVVDGDCGTDRDLVFANAVLLHLTSEDFTAAITNIHRSLRTGGRFVFSLKKGDGEGFSTEKLGAPRYFKYWQPDEVGGILAQSGYSDIYISEADAGKWLHIIAQKDKTGGTNHDNNGTDGAL